MIELHQKHGKKYFPVDLAILKEGMLLDRALYVYLEKSDNYVCLANPLTPLSSKILSKLKKHMKVFSDAEALETRYPELMKISLAVSNACENRMLAPFERNRAIRIELGSVMDKILKDHSAGSWNANEANAGFEYVDPVFTVCFMQKTFELPEFTSLEYLENISVEAFSNSVKRAALAGALALLMGFSDKALLEQYMTSVFCEDAFAIEGPETGVIALSKLHQRFSNVLLSSTRVMTGEGVGLSFDAMPGSLIDELWDLSNLSRYLVFTSAKKSLAQTEIVSYRSRVLRKVKREMSVLTMKEGVQKAA